MWLLLISLVALADIPPPPPDVPDTRCGRASQCPAGQERAAVQERQAWAYEGWTFLCREGEGDYVYCAPPGTPLRSPPPRYYSGQPSRDEQPKGSPYELASVTCDRFVALEAPAILGQLGPGQIACVEARVADPADPERAHGSRLLLAQAMAADERERWWVLVRRHLETLDPEDPDLWFKAALYARNVGSHEEALRYAEGALARTDAMSAEVRERRRLQTTRIAARAAHALWAVAVVHGLGVEVEDARLRALGHAESWAALEPTEAGALELCRSLGGCGG